MASIAATDIDARTDKLIALLQEDTRLGDGLSREVRVGKGMPTEFVGEYQVWVAYQQTVRWDMWGEGHGGEMEVVWRFRFLWQRVGDPEELEADVAGLTSNVLAILADHVNEAGYWQAMSVAGGSALNERTRSDQGHERQDLAVRVKWTHASL